MASADSGDPRDIDQLYQLPLSEFTQARNELAKRFSGDEAKRVKRLAKPGIVPWTVNQLYWQARPMWDGLLASGAELRTAQVAALQGTASAAGGLRTATDAHRKRLADALREAHRLARAAAVNPPADPLARMLEALSLAPHPAGDIGRFTTIVLPAGLEALAGIQPGAVRSRSSNAAPAPDSQRQTPAPLLDPAAERRRLQREEVALKAREKARDEEIRRLRRALDHAVTREADARSALDRARADVRALESQLAELGAVTGTGR